MNAMTTLPRPLTISFTPDAVAAPRRRAVRVPRWLAFAALVAAVVLVARLTGFEPSSAAEFGADQLAITVDRLQGFAYTLDHGLRDPLAFTTQVPAAFR